MSQLNQSEPEGPREVMNEVYDKTVPVHDPTPRPDEPTEVFPYQVSGRDKDFRPINTIEYPDVEAKPEEDEIAEVEEVLTAPKDSPVPESVESSTSEPTMEPESPESQEKTAPVEKDSGQLKDLEPGSPTSSDPTTTGESEPPAKTSGLPPSMIPSFPAKQS